MLYAAPQADKKRPRASDLLVAWEAAHILPLELYGVARKQPQTVPFRRHIRKN